MSTPTSAGRETRSASAAGARIHSAAISSVTAYTRRYAALTATALTAVATTVFLAPAPRGAPRGPPRGGPPRGAAPGPQRRGGARRAPPHPPPRAPG
ncbi:hypothetical protein, partial [Nocardia abscessus]|uniref:hypothetical protein n=1 Tax=Nocardia abscessus TaxID=120957 RepID=UPI002457CCA2